jgi:hypothetical protein
MVRGISLRLTVIHICTFTVDMDIPAPPPALPARLAKGKAKADPPRGLKRVADEDPPIEDSDDDYQQQDPIDNEEGHDTTPRKALAHPSLGKGVPRVEVEIPSPPRAQSSHRSRSSRRARLEPPQDEEVVAIATGSVG